MNTYQFDLPIEDFGAMKRFSKLYEEAVHYHAHPALAYRITPHQLRRLLTRALRTIIVLNTFWEVDIHDDELYISSIPNKDGECDYFLAFKQYKNSTSFIVSDAAIEGLWEDQITEKRSDPITTEMQEKMSYILDHFAPEIKTPECTPQEEK